MIKSLINHLSFSPISKDVPVAAAIYDEDLNIVSISRNLKEVSFDPTAHAEIIAIKMAALSIGNYRLCGTTIYSTIEPCIMCMGAIIHSRFARLVYGASDPKWGAAGSIYNFAYDNRLNHKIEIVSGVCFNETREIIKVFFKDKRSNKQCQI
ncbi:MAG: nucleoside deaminase [Desulfamplus sp.]|nr:nucleoside deaminase [Desulfamplus sp.]